MKERLIQLLDLEQLSPSKFADIIGVQRSSISHVISGRNKPSFDFLQKTLKAFPGLNASWLMLGEGNMYEQMGRNVSGNLFDSPEQLEESPEELISDSDELSTGIQPPDDLIPSESGTESSLETPAPPVDSSTTTPVDAIRELSSNNKKKVVQVMIIYEDDTFRAILPAN